MALEKTESVSPGLSVPETAVGVAYREDEKQFSRAEGAEPRFSRDNLAFQGDKAQLISGPGGSGWLIIQRCGRRERRAGLKSSPTLEARRRRNRCSSSLVLFYFIYSVIACNRRWGPVFPVQLRTRVLIRSAIESINHSIFIHSRLNHIQRAPTAQSPRETRSVVLSQTSPSTCFDVPAN